MDQNPQKNEVEGEDVGNISPNSLFSLPTLEEREKSRQIKRCEFDPDMVDCVNKVAEKGLMSDKEKNLLGQSPKGLRCARRSRSMHRCVKRAKIRPRPPLLVSDNEDEGVVIKKKVGRDGGDDVYDESILDPCLPKWD